MTVNQFVNLLAASTLIEMTITLGLGTRMSDVVRAVKQPYLLSRVFSATHILVPEAALGPLVLFQITPTMVAARLLIDAVCPRAPCAPAFTSMSSPKVMSGYSGTTAN